MPSFDVEAARKAGYSDDEILAELSKNSKFDVNRGLQAGYAKDELIRHLSRAVNPPAPSQQPEPGMVEQGVQMGKDFLAGAGSGVFSTIKGAAGLVRLPESEYLNKLATAPASTAGQVGRFAEQGAEFLIPAGAVNRGVGLLKNAPAVARIAGRAGLEGLSAAGIAGVQSGGDPEAMRNAALTAGVATGTLGAAAEAVPAVAGRLGRTAQKLYEKAVYPTKEGTKYLSKTQVVPGLLERRMRISSADDLLEKSRTQIDKWGQRIGDAWNKVPQDTPLDVTSILKALDDSAAEAVVQMPGGKGVNLGPAANTIVNHADEMKKVLLDISTPNPQTGALETTVGALRQAKGFSDKIAAKAGAFEGRNLADDSLASMYETVGNASREQLAKNFPEVDELNKQYNFWKNAEKVGFETSRRQTGQQGGLQRSIANTVGTGVGAAVGSQIGGTAGTMAGAIVGAKTTDLLQKAMTSPGWRTTSAVTRQRLSDALANGNIPKAEFYMRQILNAGTQAVREAVSPRRDESRVTRSMP